MRIDPLIAPHAEPDEEHVRPGWTEDDWDAAELLPKTHGERLPRNRSWLRWILFALVVALLAAVLTGGAIGMWMVRQVNPPGERGAEVTFTVNAGDDLESVTERLKAQGIITDARVFKWYVKRKGGLETLTPGYYIVHPRDTMGNIVKQLRIPPAQTYTKVNFPEGFTLRQMSKRLSDKVSRLQANEFLNLTTGGSIKPTIGGYPEGETSLEGLLFPATYEIAGNQTEAEVVDKLMKAMERVNRQLDIETRAPELGLKPYQVMIVASIIEREANNDEDRAKIARVIYNRLFFGSNLEIDATLFYGQPPDTPFDVLRNTDTPYNSYLHPGLPPTPISNPGKASIRAALNPADNPAADDPICIDLPEKTPCVYLYYVLADTDGHHAFSATFEQHTANIEIARAAGVLPA
jgi:UPF0755 protein